MSLQEKFQITLPPKNDETSKDDTWQTFESARNANDAALLHKNNSTSAEFVAPKFNMLPPGMDISNQRRMTNNEIPLSMAGETDPAGDVNAMAFAKGFSRYNLGGADDQYTGEHMDHFYGEAVDENGNVGFVERNNYLDRE